MSPLGNPGMPMKMPFGPGWFKDINWNIPNAVQSVVPGFETMATALMKQTISSKGEAGVAELREARVEGGVELIGCQMTVDLFGFGRDDFIPAVKDYVGAASFVPWHRQGRRRQVVVLISVANATLRTLGWRAMHSDPDHTPQQRVKLMPP